MKQFTYIVCFVCLFGNRINAQDAIDPASIVVARGVDVRNWRIGSRVTHVDLTPSDFTIHHTAESTWPDAIPPGWTGPIQSTLWIVVKGPDGVWRTTGSLEFWKGRVTTGGPLSDGLRNWWFRAPEIGQPHAGDVVGVFLAAGDQREKDVRTIEERTNIVAFTVPPNDSGSFDFGSTPAPPPVVVTPPPTPPPAPPIAGLEARLLNLEIAVAAARQADQNEHQAIREDMAEQHAALKVAIDQPGWFTQIVSNRYFQMVIAGIGTCAATHCWQGSK